MNRTLYFRRCMLVALLGCSMHAMVGAQDSAAAEDILIADFEADTYGDWVVEGEAFGTGPAKGTLPGQMGVSGFEGRGLVNSFTGGDGTTGRLTSPAFTIQKPFLNFLIGGGGHVGQTCLNLKVDGAIVRTATGPNTAGGGTEQLDWEAWDVSDLQGKQALLEIVDTHTGGWGHINVDQINQSERSRATAPRERTLLVDSRYLLLPVQNGATRRRMQVLHGDQVVREFEIEIAEGKPDFWVHCDLQPWLGKEIVLRAGKLPESSQALDSLRLSAEPPADPLPADPDRPQIHFTAHRGWLNDPNGLVQVNGVWHLFYQHNPYGWGWGNMHWGHATSRDLLHWEHQPIALTPREFGDWAFSGSAVVDADNTSGWKSGDNPLIVGAYTSTGRGECIIYSHDLGQTWTEFEGNPVVKHAGRDPRLLWHAPTSRWIMAVYNESEGKQWIAFYSSPDLKQWEFTSKIEGYYECPDLFELPVEGAPGESKWVLYGADGLYSLGQFDGRTFHPDGGKQRLWHGNFYAAQTFSNVADGRRIQIGWGQGIEFPGKPFNQQLTLPVELKLRKSASGVRMTALPVREFDESLPNRETTDATVGPDQPLQLEGILSPQEITLEVAASAAGTLRLEVFGEPVVIDFGRKSIQVCQVPPAPIEMEGDRLVVRIVVDRGSLEAFVGEGVTAVSAKARPRQDSPGLIVRREGAPVSVKVQVARPSL